jgi:hypothetical protein
MARLAFCAISSAQRFALLRGPATLGLAIVALAGCPRKTPEPPPPPAGAGCPTAAGVYVASYVTQTGGRSGWVLPLHAVGGGADAPDYAAVDPAVATAAGAPAAPTGTAWLQTANSAPCRATIGRYYAAKIDGPPASISYGVELEGCPAPANPEEAGGLVLVSDAAPTGCRFEAPQPIAARVGEMDANKRWQRPAKETPLPPPIAALVPQRECRAPDCEMLWAFGEVKVGGATVAWSGAVNWLAIGPPDQQCQWKAERFSGFFVPAQGGAAVRVTEGQQRPVVLHAVLVDGSGAKVLLADGPGEYATYDLAGGSARLGHRIAWMLAPEDAWEAVDHLGPICEPPPQRP